MNQFPASLFRVATAATATFLLGSIVGCNGPLAMIPGGQLKGPVSGYPESWDFAFDVIEISLETDPSSPHSVTTWSAVSNGSLNISTSLLHGSEDPASRDWVQAVLQEDAVRVKIADEIFEGRLSRVSDRSERKQVMDEFVRKYSLERGPRSKAAWIFKLSPRESRREEGL